MHWKLGILENLYVGSKTSKTGNSSNSSNRNSSNNNQIEICEEVKCLRTLIQRSSLSTLMQTENNDFGFSITSVESLGNLDAAAGSPSSSGNGRSR